MWNWYRPIDRALDSFLKIYMPIEVWGLAIGLAIYLLWLFIDPGSPGAP